MKIHILVALSVNIIWRVASECDDSIDKTIEPGNLGQSDKFVWLGVLRIRVESKDQNGLAVTGLVLVSKKYALVSADEVTKIPPRVFKTETRAMFLPTTDKPWYCPPKSYKTHHEYEYKTMNTIGLLELDLDNSSPGYPLRPVCFTRPMNFNISSNLFVTGYTDQNQLLEKVLYRARYIENQMCEEFYNRSGQADPKQKPIHYNCIATRLKKKHCAWENGMALVTNITGYFSLVGFGIRGPGCFAPARFLDMDKYFNWVESSVSSKQEIYDYEMIP